MRIIAIGNIIGRKDTEGIRILNVDNRQVMDVPTHSIKEAIINGKATIENIGLSEGKLVGTNGSIDRLPKIQNGNLIGKSPLIILNQLSDGGYIVSDYKGTIIKMTKDNVIDYAKVHGISNGKLCNRENIGFISAAEYAKVHGIDNGKLYNKENIEYISAISGSFSVIQSDVNEGGNTDSKKQSDKGLYTGNIVTGVEAIPVILTGNGINIYKRHCQAAYNLYRYENGKFTDKYIKEEPLRMKMDSLYKKNEMYFSKGTALVGKVPVQLGLQGEDIKLLIRKKSFTDIVDKMIKDMKVLRQAENYRVDKETGVVIPNARYSYKPIVVEYSPNDLYENNDYIDNSKVEYYLKCLNVMKVHIWNIICLTRKNTILYRKCTKKGINYRVLGISEYGYNSLSEVNIEEIYNNADRYDNIVVDGDEITITAMDGAYKYNINKLYDTYNRKIIKSNKALKAALMNTEYKEVINEKGDLIRLKSDSEDLIIPSNVIAIEKCAIEVIKENRRIIFGENIKSSSLKAITSHLSGYSHVEYIEINCDKKAGESIVNSLSKIRYKLKDTVLIKFNRDITPQEFLLITRECSLNLYNIDSTNKNKINDEFIEEVIQVIIKKDLSKLSMLNEPIEVTVEKVWCDGKMISKNYAKLLFKFDSFTVYWDKILKNYASTELKTKIYKMINSIRSLAEERTEELLINQGNNE